MPVHAGIVIEYTHVFYQVAFVKVTLPSSTQEIQPYPTPRGARTVGCMGDAGHMGDREQGRRGDVENAPVGRRWCGGGPNIATYEWRAEPPTRPTPAMEKVCLGGLRKPECAARQRLCLPSMPTRHDRQGSRRILKTPHPRRVRTCKSRTPNARATRCKATKS